MMVDAGAVEAGADQQGGDPGARTELVGRAVGVAQPGWRHVVPLPAELVIGDDDQSVPGLRAGGDGLDQIDQMIRAVGFAGVAGMFVLRPVGLDETHRRQLAPPGGLDELGLVPQVAASGLARGVRGEVVQGLMVVLEQRPGMPGVRVAPAAGVPVPADLGLGEPVTDVRIDGIVDQRQLRAATERRAGRLHGVDRIVAAGQVGERGRAGLGQLRILDRGTGRGRVQGVAAVGEAGAVHDRVQVGGAAGVGRVGVDRGTGGDQVLMVEERSAEGRLEEVVGDHVIGCAAAVQVLVDRQCRGVVDTHRQTDGVAAGDVAILPTTVELILLLVEAVDQIPGTATSRRAVAALEDPVRGGGARGRAGLVLRPDEVVDREVGVGESAGRHVVGLIDAGGGHRAGGGQVDVVLQQAAVGVAVLGDLGGVDLPGIGQPGDRFAVDRTPGSVEVVEAVVLLVDHHHVLEPVDGGCAAAVTGPRRGVGGGRGGADDHQQQSRRQHW